MLRAFLRMHGPNNVLKARHPNYGDKLKDISKNLSKSQQKVKKQGDAINKANDDALNLLKNLMK